jgi:hypothetical protein
VFGDAALEDRDLSVEEVDPAQAPVESLSDEVCVVRVT